LAAVEFPALCLLVACALSALGQASEEERRKQWLERVLKAQNAAPAPPVRSGDGVTAEDVERPVRSWGGR